MLFSQKYKQRFLNLHHLIPGYGHPNKHKVYRVSINIVNDDDDDVKVLLQFYNGIANDNS